MEKNITLNPKIKMKRSERVLLNKEDVKEAILCLCRDEFNIPDDYRVKREIDVTIGKVDVFKDGDLYIDATLEWEDDE